MKQFDPIEEAQDAAATAGEKGPVLSWLAADHFLSLDVDEQTRWERAYIDELVRLGQPARLVNPYSHRPQARRK